MPAAPEPDFGSQSQGRGGDDNDGLYTRSDQDRRRARRRTPSLIATSLRLRPARRLLTVGAGGLHAAARTRRQVLQAPRWTSAALYKPRYRASEASELLRALSQPEASAGARSHRRRPSTKLP